MSSRSVRLALALTGEPVVVRCAISLGSSTTDKASSHSSATASSSTTLLTLPSELLVELVSGLDVPTLGMAASSCSFLSRFCEREGVWSQLCAKQGLVVQEGDTPQASLRCAATCGHAADQRPSQAYVWEVDAFGWRCECGHCGRRYDVIMTTGFVDTPTFASKLVTRADFAARHDAPESQRSFVVLWDARSAGAAKKAGEISRSVPGGTLKSWNSGTVTFLGPRMGAHPQHAEPLSSEELAALRLRREEQESRERESEQEQHGVR